ncbi:zinc dependent phospholipase C family protein [Desulfovibrio aminophilus]|nr:zinc dependent phospholipase C family protein [Desulfovibrio aminophilus]MCM0756901.1 zinc dependent phospholipase C family protein [Desulfovibrio aminophilus]
MRKALTAVIGLVITILVLPGDALAWGPGVHLAVGGTILENLGLVSPFIADILARHRDLFLYGSISADIFIGKGSRIHDGHSHNWDTGFALLHSARDPGLRAYAYGYLSHLAADTVAHNYYVPNILAAAPQRGKLGHVYLEMQADRAVDWNPRRARRLFSGPSRAADGILLDTLHKNRLPFLFRKQVFKNSLRVCGRKTLGSSLDLIQRTMPWADSSAYLADMLDLSLRVVVDFFRLPQASPALALDPIGSRNLEMARRLSRKPAFRRSELPLRFQVDACLSCLPPLPGNESTRVWGLAANQ